MQVGKPLREFIVEPLELPEPIRPESVPDREPVPIEEPVAP
jgi:hypothetical protein